MPLLLRDYVSSSCSGCVSRARAVLWLALARFGTLLFAVEYVRTVSVAEDTSLLSSSLHCTFSTSHFRPCVKREHRERAPEVGAEQKVKARNETHVRPETPCLTPRRLTSSCFRYKHSSSCACSLSKRGVRTGDVKTFDFSADLLRQSRVFLPRTFTKQQRIITFIRK
ncbi:hypothetical protein WMY93_033465 [Mugilogobius chulae]|uniref:Transmembrane protein n=1 Tax=Mugilogobius chulae TaxID=88201 RepID=A0AAW0MH69_9GOBI